MDFQLHRESIPLTHIVQESTVCVGEDLGSKTCRQGNQHDFLSLSGQALHLRGYYVLGAMPVAIDCSLIFYHYFTGLGVDSYRIIQIRKELPASQTCPPACWCQEGRVAPSARNIYYLPRESLPTPGLDDLTTNIQLYSNLGLNSYSFHPNTSPYSFYFLADSRRLIIHWILKSKTKIIN